MPEPYQKTTHDGKTVDWLTKCALLEAEIRLGYRLTVVQGSYHKGVGASAGTHDGGGTVDLAAWDHVRKVRVLRDVGFAVWWRQNLPGVWSEHIHGVLIGNDKLAPVAARQVTAYRNRRDGLAGNRSDLTYRPSPIPTYRWPGSDGALALQAKAAALLDKPKPKPVPKPEPGLRVDGIDLSHHNDVTQAGLEKAVAAGVRWVYHKATEGTTIVDKTYAARRELVKAVDVPFGAYHFARPNKGESGTVEARAFLAAAQPVAGDMRPMLDLEDDGGLGRATLTKWVAQFVAEVKRQTGVLPIIYTPFSLDDNFGCMLWVARYSNTNAEPKIPAPWKKWRIRQFSNGEYGRPVRVPGMGAIDLNTMHDGEKLDWFTIPVKPVLEDPKPEPVPPVVVEPAPEPDPAVALAPFRITQANVQQTDSDELTIPHIRSIAFPEDPALAPDVIVWNEIGTKVLQGAVKALDGFLSHIVGGVGISWRTARFLGKNPTSTLVNKGALSFTPNRYILSVDLVDQKTAKTYRQKAGHSVHHIEAGGKPRIKGALLGQNARARLYFETLAAEIAADKAELPVAFAGDLNVNMRAEKALPPSERCAWFPYTLLGQPLGRVRMPNKGTHGERAIDWFVVAGAIDVGPQLVLPHGSSDHNPLTSVVTLTSV